MPELPDITVYIEALEPRVIRHTLDRIQLNSPFLLRTAAPAINSIEGQSVITLRRLGKRICFGFKDELWLVLHLMIAGRLHWKGLKNSIGAPETASRSKNHLASFQFDNGLLTLTEAGTQRRASLHLVKGEDSLRALDRGGIELFQQSDKQRRMNAGLGKFIDLDSFARVLRSENHTLKRALTDPRLFSGIGNAYSDEILWNAQLSPIRLTQKMSDDEVQRLHNATRETLVDWVERLRAEANGKFPEKVTAFRKDMATHGRYKEPCPRCGAKIQRIRYATNETNYCPNCQTAGKLLADRALSRLLREDWPKNVDELV
ncbi:MAG TPA: DNA-formamidopyrimidine glycosylase family protein [Pyrinomonadaceae bacterium]|nr:DNA-formamidopyrimidine glycosylase family protein [Pyrinomonadaceae bacterium]